MCTHYTNIFNIKNDTNYVSKQKNFNCPSLRIMANNKTKSLKLANTGKYGLFLKEFLTYVQDCQRNKKIG